MLQAFLTPSALVASPGGVGRGPSPKLTSSYRRCLSYAKHKLFHWLQNLYNLATPAPVPPDMHAREGRFHFLPPKRRRESQGANVQCSPGTHNGKSEVSDFSDLEPKRLSLKRKTCHLPAKINCDESLDPPLSAKHFLLWPPPGCLAPAPARGSYF